MDELLASSGTCIEQFILASLLYSIFETGVREMNQVRDYCNYMVRNFNNSFFDVCNRNFDMLSLSLCILCNTLNNFKLYK